MVKPISSSSCIPLSDLRGQHIHHGLFKSPTETKEEAQVNLVKYLLEISDLPKSSQVLDVGCGLGGTSQYLAKEHGCAVTGITISGRQVEIAKRLALAESTEPSSPEVSALVALGRGKVQFLELDAENMLSHFTTNPPSESFTCIWISEALSHFPNKPNFFTASYQLLQSNHSSRLVIADWFKAPSLTPEQEEADIKPIEDGMLLPRLFTVDEYVDMAKDAGFTVRSGPHDISRDVAKTW